MNEQIAIYGAGGFAREVAWLIRETSTPDAPLSVACFVDDATANHGKSLHDIPVMGLEQAKTMFPNAKLVGAVGSPALREKLMQKASAAGFETRSVIHPRTEKSQYIEYGEGTIICAGNILTTDIKLGRHVQINLGCTIGHDVVLDDYATLAPGVHVSGCVRLGKRAYVGTGAVIINGTQDTPLVIGDDAVVGAGACVTKSVSAGLTVVGVPAKPLGK